MYSLEEVREQVELIVDPDEKKSLKETNGIKEINIDENIVSLIIKVKDPKSDGSEMLKKTLIRLIKINLGFKGIKLKLEGMDEQTEKKAYKIITIGSGKGGVGKSTVTANIALALNRLKKKVAIIDADIYGPSIPNVMELELTEIYADENGKMLPHISKDGIEIISTEFFTDHEQPLMWRGGMLGKMLGHFFNDIKWSDDIEYLLVDLPPGTGDVAIDMKQFAYDSKMIIVSTPHIGAANIAVKAGYGALQVGQKIFGVIENMSYFINPINKQKEEIFGSGGGALASMKLNTKLLAQIPIGIPSGKYHSLYEEDDLIGKIYIDIAKKIIDEI